MTTPTLGNEPNRIEPGLKGAVFARERPANGPESRLPPEGGPRKRCRFTSGIRATRSRRVDQRPRKPTWAGPPQGPSNPWPQPAPLLRRSSCDKVSGWPKARSGIAIDDDPGKYRKACSDCQAGRPGAPTGRRKPGRPPGPRRSGEPGRSSWSAFSLRLPHPLRPIEEMGRLRGRVARRRPETTRSRGDGGERCSGRCTRQSAGGLRVTG